MALYCKIIAGRIKAAITMRAPAWAVLVIAALFVPLGTTHAAAAITLMETQWQTGQLEVTWEGAVDGVQMTLYTRTWHDTTYEAHDGWVATESGTHISRFFENGQTVWYYVSQTDPLTGAELRSNEVRQTPPITAYIINWPEIWGDMSGEGGFGGIAEAIDRMNQGLQEKLDQLFTPSPQAMADLQDAIDDLKNGVGVGQAEQIGGQLQTGFNNIANGASPPVVTDDGEGTFTGGANPGELPELEGTMNDVSFCVPITQKMDGSMFRVCLLTDEQLEKMKWWRVVYDLLSVVPWVLFAVWIVQRFTPQFKV